MKRLELDLNKLSDEQLRKYLELKEALGLVDEKEQEEPQIVDEKEEPESRGHVIFRRPKKYKKRKTSRVAEKWRTEVEQLEPYLAKPRTRSQIFKKMKMTPHGGNYKTLGRYLSLIYKRRLKTISVGRTVFYQLDKKPLREVREEPIDEVYEKVHELIKSEAISFADAYKKATGYEHVGGHHYQTYREYCENLGEEFPTKRGRPKKKKEVPKHKEYMLRKNPYLTWRGKHLKKVMDIHNLNVQDATKYLAATWMKSDKNPEKADEKVIFEIKTEMIEEPYEKEVAKEVTLPMLKNLKPRFGKVLIDMIRHIMETPELKLGYEPEGRMLGIDYYYDWTDFCRDFLEKSQKIALRLNIQDKFVLIGFGKNGMAIQYR